jgi:PASTA domain
MRWHLQPVLRVLATAFAAGLLLVLPGCGSTQPRVVPDVTGERLDVAEDTLDALGLRYETAGGGDFGIVVRSNWVVCAQSPPPDWVASRVLLTVTRSCSGCSAAEEQE